MENITDRYLINRANVLAGQLNKAMAANASHPSEDNAAYYRAVRREIEELGLSDLVDQVNS